MSRKLAKTMEMEVRKKLRGRHFAGTEFPPRFPFSAYHSSRISWCEYFAEGGRFVSWLSRLKARADPKYSVARKKKPLPLKIQIIAQIGRRLLGPKQMGPRQLNTRDWPRLRLNFCVGIIHTNVAVRPNLQVRFREKGE